MAPLTLRLSEYAKQFTYPAGITRTVFTRVQAKGIELGLLFDWWQSQLGSVCLGYDEHGRYVSTVGGIGMSIPRQVGKTYFVLAMLVIMCILFPGLQVVWTAHHLRTSTKTFTSLRAICRRKKVAPYVRALRSANGEQQVEFTNGSMIMFGARSQGFGRGFDEVDVEVFDEAQIMDTKALEDMIAATNQARHQHGALLFFMGTPPRDSDPSESFRMRRDEAWAGAAEDAIWLEMSADPNSDPNDESQWPLMNPSFPLRTPRESLLRLRKNLKDDDSWNREGRGIWDPLVSGGVIPMSFWENDGDELSMPADRFALGLEAGPGLAYASVSLAGQRGDGKWHIELDENRQGSDWLIPYVKRLVESNPQLRSVVCDVGGPMVALLEQKHSQVGTRAARWFLKGTKVEVTPMAVKELGAGCSVLLNGVVTGEIVHIRQPQLTAAAKVATKRNLGDTGMWVFHRASSASDITPIQSATYALVGAQNTNVKRPGRGRTSERRAVLL